MFEALLIITAMAVAFIFGVAIGAIAIKLLS